LASFDDFNDAQISAATIFIHANNIHCPVEPGRNGFLETGGANDITPKISYKMESETHFDFSHLHLMHCGQCSVKKKNTQQEIA